MADGAKFEVGKIYGHRFIGDSNARVYWRVSSRSASMMTIVDVSEGSTGETNRVKIRNQPGEGEWAYPMGQYSMAPIIRANREGKFSRPGEKDMMAREVVARKGSKRVELSGPQADGRWVVTVMQEEKQVVPGETNDRFVDSKFYSTEAGARRAASKMLASRPGEKATFKVEDRFYFGKGRKERFADDVKQIADTILKQLGGGRFIAMTGAKNLAFMSNPPGLHMSIGRGTKDGIKYLRVNYDRGSDTYNMIFANKSGSTVKSVNHIQANALQRVFTSTTGFDTYL